MATKSYENNYYNQGYRLVAGCDEAGRGPLAGPLVVAAVILPHDYDNPQLHDSKQLSDNQRRALVAEIHLHAIAFAIETLSVEDVDRLNVYQASRIGMMRCLARLPMTQAVLTDAMPLPLEIPCQAIIKGDTLSQSIAAASILAKVTRDDYMNKLAERYPAYGFDHHKGYGTPQHLAALRTYGVISEHRRTFAPIRNLLQPTLFDE